MQGAQIFFDVQQEEGPNQKGHYHLEVYTTRPDTIFGATYMVVAPEHPMVESLVTQEYQATVEEYITMASAKSDRERSELQKDKTGVFTGAITLTPVMLSSTYSISLKDHIIGLH